MTRSLLAVGLGCALAVPAAAQPKRSPALLQALADWEARQARHRTARYVFGGTRELVNNPPGSGPFPPSNDRVRPLRLEVVLDLARGRYRYEHTFDELDRDGSYGTYQSANTFDGREHRQWKPRERVSRYGGCNLIITPRADKSSDGVTPNVFVWPVLYAHGLVPNPATAGTFATLPWRYDPEDYVYAGRLPLAGRGCDVVRTEPNEWDPPGQEEYWVDPVRTGAILRYARKAGDHTSTRVDLRWRATPTGWELDGWTAVQVGYPNVTQEVETYRLESAEFDGPVADAEFTIPAEPGMTCVRVNEYDPRPGVVLGPARYYRIDPDGTWVQTDAQGAVTVDGLEPPPPRRRPWWHWAVLAAGVLALPVGVWRWRRWRRWRRSPPPGPAA